MTPAEERRRQLEATLAELQKIDRDEQIEKAMNYQEPGAFAAFVQWAWPIVEPRPLEWAPYLDVICHALQRQMLGDPEYRRLVINIPPGYAKSLLVSVFAPAYEWLFNPSRRKLFFAGDDHLTRRDSRRTRQILTDPGYQEMVTRLCARESRKPWELAADQNAKDNFENTDRGFRQCLTLRSGVTGKRGDDFVIDDPIDVKAVTIGGHESIRRRCGEIQQIINEALQTRVNDRRDARQTIIMQRLAEDDPAGHAIRSGKFRVICLPLHYDPDHPHACPDDPRTERGELLHPGRDTVDDVADLVETLGVAQAEAQLEQRPMPAKGGQIQREWFETRYANRPEDIAAAADEVWVSADAAKKGGENNDYHAVHVWARKGNLKYLLDRRAERVGYPGFERLMDSVIAQWAPSLVRGGGVLIEDAANGTTYMQVKGGSHMGVSLIPFSPQKDTPGSDKGKAARATYIERAANAGTIILPEVAIAPWVEDVLMWWCAFPRGKHDDDVDAASQILMRWAVRASKQVDPNAHLGFLRLLA